VELNNSFYRPPERDTFVTWRERTPGDFLLAVKMSRYLTHVRRLRDPADPVALAAVLARFPRDVPVTVEPRHASWWNDEIRRGGAALVDAAAFADRCRRHGLEVSRTPTVLAGAGRR
jgi:uncharacterized protein YecE (DUF72 family)